MQRTYDYDISFESGDKRIRARHSGFNIHEVIRKIRKEYPDAHMFIIIRKALSL